MSGSDEQPVGSVWVTTMSGSVVEAQRSEEGWSCDGWDGSPPVGIDFNGFEMVVEQRDANTFGYAEAQRPGRGFTSVSDASSRTIEEHLASVEAYVRGLLADDDLPD